MTTTYHIADIRNVALAGHGASGKTSLADALLFAAGATPRKGSVDDGTSTLDYDDEEKRRHFTIDCHLGHLAWNDKQVHLIDSPGYPDFIGNALGALAAVENVVLAVSGPAGIEVNTRQALQGGPAAGARPVHRHHQDGRRQRRLPIRPGIDPRNLRQLVRAVQRADRPGGGLLGRGRRASDRTTTTRPNCPLPPSEAYQMVVEQIVETDEDLMTRYLEGETIDVDELRKAAHDAIAAGKLVPILCVCTRKDLGVKELLDLITTCGLSPDDVHRFGTRGEDGEADDEEILPAEDGTLVAQVFKTANDQFMGKLSFLRILSGRIASDTNLVNLRSGKTSKAGHVYVLQGKQQEEVSEAIAGDLVAIAKFDDLHVSDTVSNVGGNTAVRQLKAAPIKFPTPMVPRAVEPKAREDEAKISVGLAKIADEDPTFTIRRDAQTHELVISGMSDLHLDVIQQRLKNRYKLEMSTRTSPTCRTWKRSRRRPRPTTATRSRPAVAASSPRSTSGSDPSSAARASTFVDAVKGGVIPGQYIPAVEKGVREQMDQGRHLGQPGGRRRGRGLLRQGPPGRQLGAGVQDGRRPRVPQGVREGEPRAARTDRDRRGHRARRPSSATSSADMSTRRGHITGMETLSGGQQTIQATVPLAEMLSYASTLKSMTSGPGLVHHGDEGLRGRPAQHPAADRRPLPEVPRGDRGRVSRLGGPPRADPARRGPPFIFDRPGSIRTTTSDTFRGTAAART